MNDNDIRVFKILKKAKLVTLTNFMLTIKDDGITGVAKKLEINWEEKDRRKK